MKTQLLAIPEMRKGSIVLIEKVASTSTAARYPSRSASVIVIESPDRRLTRAVYLASGPRPSDRFRHLFAMIRRSVGATALHDPMFQGVHSTVSMGRLRGRASTLPSTPRALCYHHGL